MIKSRTRWPEQNAKITHIFKLNTNDDREISALNEILEQGEI